MKTSAGSKHPDHEMVSVPVARAAIFHRLGLPLILLDTQLFTIPVMKTHAKTGITGALRKSVGVHQPAQTQLPSRPRRRPISCGRNANLHAMPFSA